jgi:hypothetical protein
MAKTLGPFTSRQTAILSDVSPKTLHYWSTTMFIVPSVKPPSGPGRGRGKQVLYSFQDVVAAKTAAELRKCGISLQALRRVVGYLKGYKRATNPLAEARLVATHDGDVLGILPPDKTISLKKQPGQFVFYDLSYGEIVRQLRAEAERMMNEVKNKAVG